MTEVENSKLVKRAGYLAVIITAIIIIAKSYAWLRTDSLGIYASLVDSLLDIAASLVNLLAIHYALQPPDNEHRFGHGKAEDLAVLTQSSLFAISGIVVTITAIKKLINPTDIPNGLEGIALMGFSIVATIILVLYQRYVIRKTQSSVIKADNFHYFIDVITNLATILAVVLAVYFDFRAADPIFAIIIAIYIFYGAWKLLRHAFNNLMDKELKDDDKQAIKDIILANKMVNGFHDLKTRYAGNKVFIQFHLEMNGQLTLNQAHSISEAIEHALLEKMPEAEIIIHQDPEGVDEEVEYKD